jgi:hypothetical protein
MSRGTEIDKAELLGERLVGGATEAACIILEELGKRYKIVIRNEESTPLFIIEVMVLYMHLVDRQVQAHLGPTNRDPFMDRFVETVLRESTAGLASVPANNFGRTLRDVYNRRQMEYTKYRLLLPEKDGILKNTLYWEFSKILFGFVDDSSPVTLGSLNILVAHVSSAMMNSVLKVEEVLQS